MKVVSKFSIAYIVSGIFVLVVLSLIAFMACFAVPTWNQLMLDEYGSFIFEPKKIIIFIFLIIGIIIFYLFTFGKFLRITCTEDYIYFDNFVTRKFIDIEYNEIENIIRHKEVGAGGTFTGNYRTCRYEYSVILKNGKIIKFDDFPYDDFEEVDKCMFENFKKKNESYRW